MRILGIDPGYDRVGVAIVDANGSSLTYIYSTCITTDRALPFTERLVEVGNRLREVLAAHKPEGLAIETLFVTKNQKTAMDVAEARGVILYECTKSGLKIKELTPGEIKQALTGYGKAEKEAVFKMTEKLVDVPDRAMYDDEMDAIATAIAGSSFLKS